MRRRDFLRLAAAGLVAPDRARIFASISPLAGGKPNPAPDRAQPRQFWTDDPLLARTWQAALAVLRANLETIPPYTAPTLIEGSVYHGVWLECGPQEAEVYAAFLPAPETGAPALARHNHEIFFALQRPDGQLPCAIKRGSGAAFGQVQMAVPIAATAWELAQIYADEQLLETAYAAASRWDAWLRKYRDTRRTGLCEVFCTYDTGQDRSPRFRGIPNRCPNSDARLCPSAPGLPRLAPDLSATVFGGRLALACMARALGKSSEADRWAVSAESIRTLILDRLYDPKDAAFYDLDSSNRFVRVRGVATLRVLQEHVVPPESSLFGEIYRRQIHNRAAFWPAYPFPSIALDDPSFVRPIPRNSWGGAAQALSALRAPRWLEYYAKPADLALLMQAWLNAILRLAASQHASASPRASANSSFRPKSRAPFAPPRFSAARDGAEESAVRSWNSPFRQQMDPLTGEFTLADPGGYSPVALVFLDFLWRSSGVRRPVAEESPKKSNGSQDVIEWNIRQPSSKPASFKALIPRNPGGRHPLEAEISYAGGAARLRLDGKLLAEVSGTVRLLTSSSGKLLAAVGIAQRAEFIRIAAGPLAGREAFRFRISPNARTQLA